VATILRCLRGLGPFRAVLLLWLCLVYMWGVQWSSAMRAQVAADATALFTALMVVHFGLYRMGEFVLPRRERWWVASYLAAQAVLVVITGAVAHRFLVTLALYLPLTGETVVALSARRLLPLVGAAACVGLFAASLAVSYGSSVPIALTHQLVPLPIILLVFVPVFVLVLAYALLLVHQRRIHARTVDLLQHLEVAHQQLADYAVQVESLTLAAERQRMARELHDTLAQGLAGVILQLEAAKAHLVDGRDRRALQIVAQTMARARNTLSASRSVIDDLRAGAVPAQDLRRALDDEIDRFSAATGIPCTADVAALTDVSDATAELVVRVVTEGLLNVARHARACRAWVRVGELDRGLEIEVRDDGVGFDPAAAVSPGHYGLLGMRERARMAGGSMVLRTAPGHGTTLRLTLPAGGRGVAA
jgi:NarL family two-component system sensor histidine kinase YdfH